MRKLIFGVTGGLTLATVCGIAGLAHLSASIVTLTVFCAVPTLLVHAFPVMVVRVREETTAIAKLYQLSS